MFSINWERLFWAEMEVRLPRNSIAFTYAQLIRTGHREWTAINRAIVERWSEAALGYIKRRAWREQGEAA